MGSFLAFGHSSPCINPDDHILYLISSIDPKILSENQKKLRLSRLLLSATKGQFRRRHLTNTLIPANQHPRLPPKITILHHIDRRSVNMPHPNRRAMGVSNPHGAMSVASIASKKARMTHKVPPLHNLGGHLQAEPSGVLAVRVRSVAVGSARIFD